jgi:hypothetical protein
MAIVNPPLIHTQNPPMASLIQTVRERKRQYIRAKYIETVAIEKFRKNGRGITVQDLVSNDFAESKGLAREKIKYCRERRLLFTPLNVKPQEYFPTCLKSDVIDKLLKNAQVRVTGIGSATPSFLHDKETQKISFDSHSEVESIILQTLEGHVLPLLPKTPLYIHRLHFKVKIPRECFREIALPVAPYNKGKEHQEIIGSILAKYRFYANGSVVITTESSNNPFKLENEADYCTIMAFLGQLRDRLILFLADKHERFVPDITSWELTQWDVNKDVKIDDWAQIVGSKIQVRHACRLFRVYIKSGGRDTVCRVEESFSSKNKSAVEAISDIFNPHERLEKQISDLGRKVDQLLISRSNDTSNTTDAVADYDSSIEVERRCIN